MVFGWVLELNMGFGFGFGVGVGVGVGFRVGFVIGKSYGCGLHFVAYGTDGFVAIQKPKVLEQRGNNLP